MIFGYGHQTKPYSLTYPPGETITLIGTVSRIEYKQLQSASPPWQQSQSKKSVVYGRQTILYLKDIDNLEQDEQIICYMVDKAREPYIGQRIKIQGEVQKLREATNPGEFDSRQYYQILHISFRMKKTSILGSSRKYSPYKQTLHRIRKKLAYILEASFREQDAAVLKTMLLGDKSSLDTELKTTYQENGIIHILAISGLHISILGMGLYRLLGRLFVPPFVRAPALMVLMISYGVMTGMGPSCFRAILMFGIHLLGELLGRTYDIITALSLLAVIMLMQQPLYVRHSGFLLSFGAVMAIGFFLPVWRKIWITEERKTNRMIENIISGSAVSIITLPVLLYFNYSFPIYALLLNLLIIPLLTIVVLDGIVVLLAGFISIPASIWLSIPDRYILQLYQMLCQLIEHFYYHNMIFGRPAMWQIMIYYLLLIWITYMVNNGAPWVVKQLLVMALFILCMRFHSGLMVQFIDVGQGDGIIVRNDNGNCYLFDGGSTTQKEVGTYQIIPDLKCQGISRLSAILLSHPDEDHVNGAVSVLNESKKHNIQVDCLVLPDASGKTKEELEPLIQKAGECNVPVRFIKKGDRIKDGNLILECMNPASKIETEDVNEISETFFIEYHKFTLLLTGDITGKAEEEMVSELQERWNSNKRLSVLKVAHHGSRNSTPISLLEITKPYLAVISAGEGNTYGHPHEELLARLKKAGVLWLSTQRNGAITIMTNGNQVHVRNYKQSLSVGGSNDRIAKEKEIKEIIYEANTGGH